MPTSIYLMSLTDQGIKGIKDAPNRRAESENKVTDLGGSIVGSYLTMGAYDRLLIVDLPAGDAAVKLALGMGTTGNVRTTTMSGYSGDEAIDYFATSLPWHVPFPLPALAGQRKLSRS